MKVALYARVSLEETNEKDRRYQEPENQLVPLREWARSMNWTIIEEYIDRGSGANPARINFRKMINDAMLRKFECILVWKLDRFSREGISQVFAYIEKLRKRNVALKSMTETWLDSSKENPMAEVTLAILAWVSAFERQKISDRTKLGIQRRKNLGIWKGGRPKGSKDKIQRERGVVLSTVAENVE
jgi:site-specific DNA recombinase